MEGDELVQIQGEAAAVRFAFHGVCARLRASPPRDGGVPTGRLVGAAAAAASPSAAANAAMMGMMAAGGGAMGGIVGRCSLTETNLR
jgi:hypothetical protein